MATDRQMASLRPKLPGVMALVMFAVQVASLPSQSPHHRALRLRGGSLAPWVSSPLPPSPALPLTRALLLLSLSRPHSGPGSALCSRAKLSHNVAGFGRVSQGSKAGKPSSTKLAESEPESSPEGKMAKLVHAVQNWKARLASGGWKELPLEPLFKALKFIIPLSLMFRKALLNEKRTREIPSLDYKFAIHLLGACHLSMFCCTALQCAWCCCHVVSERVLI